MLVIERSNRKRHCLLMLLIFVLILVPDLGFSQGLSDYLIVTDIGTYEASKNPFGGTGPGILAGAGHFYLDHQDTTYEISYFDLATRSGADIQVTQHAGGDSDKWLLHEVEDAFREKERATLGLLSQGTRLRDIDGNKFFSLRGSGYNWISHNVAIDISYTDLYGNKPEPLEIVQAYLHKFPSTIPASLVLDKAHDEQWIKDEMERRLWMCDKWLQQLDEGKTEQYKALSAVVDDDLEVFLDYREKYYGISAGEEKNILYGYLQAKNEKEMRKKLTEYKSWWSSNKTKAPAL